MIESILRKAWGSCNPLQLAINNVLKCSCYGDFEKKINFVNFSTFIIMRAALEQSGMPEEDMNPRMKATLVRSSCAVGGRFTGS
jgi:hypothetical protein